MYLTNVISETKDRQFPVNWHFCSLIENAHKLWTPLFFHHEFPSRPLLPQVCGSIDFGHKGKNVRLSERICTKKPFLMLSHTSSQFVTAHGDCCCCICGNGKVSLSPGVDKFRVHPSGGDQWAKPQVIWPQLFKNAEKLAFAQQGHFWLFCFFFWKLEMVASTLRAFIWRKTQMVLMRWQKSRQIKGKIQFNLQFTFTLKIA